MIEKDKQVGFTVVRGMGKVEPEKKTTQEGSKKEKDRKRDREKNR